MKPNVNGLRPTIRVDFSYAKIPLGPHVALRATFFYSLYVLNPYRIKGGHRGILAMLYPL
jgi:hypothetical protein